MKEESKRDYIKEPLTDEEFVVMGRRMGMNETKAKQILLNSMKEESKYYTPTIEEFHVGFEFEKREDGQWKKYGSFDFEFSLERTYWGITSKNIRVKYLDREDIESFGFENANVLDDERLLFFKDFTSERGIESCGLLYIPQTNWVLLYSNIKQADGVLQGGYVIELPENKITVTGGTRFCGTIKNRSELKRVLTQIGVI